jgi:hypothetical protein
VVNDGKEHHITILTLAMTGPPPGTPVGGIAALAKGSW